MTFLTDWAKNIVYYILFVKVLTSLMPSGNMSKYFKLFSGILLIIILVQPLINLKGFDENMFKNILKIETEVDQQYLTQQAGTYQHLNDQLALNLYIKNTKVRIQNITEQTGVIVNSVKLKVCDDQKDENYGELLEISLLIKRSTRETIHVIKEIEINSQEDLDLPKSAEDILIEKNIKSSLLDFYNLPADNIHISIEN